MEIIGQPIFDIINNLGICGTCGREYIAKTDQERESGDCAGCIEKFMRENVEGSRGEQADRNSRAKG
tara:strand:+ start:3499 stop:3699 length:201 start_codon:yes stop_codon:yes gene_type:complete